MNTSSRIRRKDKITNQSNTRYGKYNEIYRTVYVMIQSYDSIKRSPIHFDYWHEWGMVRRIPKKEIDSPSK